MLNDLRFALRTLRRSPGFTLTAIVSIALAIGANSTIFSVADALVLRPLGVSNPSEVVTLLPRTKAGERRPGGFSYPDYVDFRSANKSFDGLVAFNLVPVGFANQAAAQPQLRVGLIVSGNFFSSLGVRPQLGRGFRPDEDQVPGRNAVIVLAHDLWRSELGGDPAIVGRRVRLNGRDFDVIGVAPKSFTGMDQYVRPAFYVPLAMGPALGGSIQEDLLTNRELRTLGVKGRLKAGVSTEVADAEASAIFQALERNHPDTNRGLGAAVRTELQSRAESNPFDLYLVGLLSFLVVIVLSIACGNVANLFLSHARTRAREVAVRLALGARRWRVVRQLMTESLVIALAGGALGLVIAAYVVEIFATLEVPGDVPVVLAFELNARVLWFTFGVAVLSSVLFGLVPALYATRGDPVAALRTGESQQMFGRLVGRSVLVTLQIAGSVVLTLAATQLYRGLSHALTHDLGFSTDHRLTMRLDPSLASYTLAQSEQFYDAVVERTQTLPGVRTAALSSWIPNTIDGSGVTVVPEGYEFSDGKESTRVLASTVDHNYFRALDISILGGRGFLPTDRAGSPLVVVVNDLFAKTFLRDSPVGKRIRLVSHGDRWAEVVGVSANVKQFNALAPVAPFVYLPFRQHPQSRMTLVAETSGDPATFVTPVREAISSIGPSVPVFRVRTLEDLFEQRSVKTANTLIGTVLSFGMLGLSLALIGLYAVVAYQVARRTREIGIRMAIGAAQPQVLMMILRQAAAIGVSGVLIGTVASYALEDGVTAAINVPPLEPVWFAVGPVLLLLTTLAAAAIPARRASRIDPQRALRQE